MLPILTALASSGLSLLTNAILAKGKKVVEDKLGIKIPENLKDLTPELTAKLMEVQNAHTQFLISAALEEKKVEAATEEAAAKEASSRWIADMASDNKLSKNTRPGILIYLTAVFSIVVLADLDIKDAYIQILGQLLMLVYGAYFAGRSVEKVIDMNMKGKS